MAQQVDLSGISYFMPLLSFLVVFVIIYALLFKTKIIGENKFAQVFTAFLFATIFVSAVGAREYVVNIVPWIAILIVSMFFILLIIGFIGKDAEFLHKGIGIAVVVILILIFIISGIFVFSDYLAPYLPWNNGYGANQNVLYFTGWLFSGRIFGGILLLIVSAIVSWILIKAK